MKHILLIAWEYPGQNSAQGQALVRRIGQLLDGFLERGIAVTFLYHDKKNESNGKTHHITQQANLTRIAVKYDYVASKVPLFRKLNTLYEISFLGDFTGHWARHTFELVTNGTVEIKQPDAIVAFYTPKGPLYLGKQLAQYFNITFTADLQDPHRQGTNSYPLRFLGDLWTKRTLINCREAICINKFWAKELSSVFSGKIHVIDHASVSIDLSKYKASSDSFVYYSGSINPASQDIVPFMLGLDKYAQEHPEIYLKLSAKDNVVAYFEGVKSRLGLRHIKIVCTGWITQAALYENMSQCKFLLTIPWCKMAKVGVPSKFYEYISFGKPVMIAGNDSGGLQDFLERHGHPDCILRTSEQVYEALSTGQERLFFRPEKCGTPAITEKVLVEQYLQIIGTP